MAFINKLNSLNNNINVNEVKNKVNSSNEGGDFANILKKELDSTNEALEKAEKLEAGIADGSVKDLAGANITIQKAEMQMKMMLEVRNKAISAYKELLKTQI